MEIVSVPAYSQIHPNVQPATLGLSLIQREARKFKLIKLARSVISNREHGFEISRLLSELKLSKSEVVQAYVAYNLDICSYGNEIYDSLAVRASMHLLNLLEGSWHQVRQNTIVEFLAKCNPKTIVDMGFGEPSLYVRNALKQKSTKITLCDYSDAAFVFARALLNLWSSNWNETISFRKSDMESGEYVGDFDVYIFQDSIEHISAPATFLREYIKRSPATANFIFSLPIGPIIPSHYIAWETTRDALSWLNSCGLKHKVSKHVFTNPKVDLFSESTEDPVSSLYVICGK